MLVANTDDVVISAGAGMTTLVCKFQRILGLKIHEKYISNIKFKTITISICYSYGASF